MVPSYHKLDSFFKSLFMLQRMFPSNALWTNGGPGVWKTFPCQGVITSRMRRPWTPVLYTQVVADMYSTYQELYLKIYNIRRTKSQNLNDSHLVLKSSLPNPFKSGVKSRMKMWWTIPLPTKVRLILETWRYKRLVFCRVVVPVLMKQHQDASQYRKRITIRH